MIHKADSNRDILKGVKILLVEDNRINQEVTAAMLNQGGMLVEIAENGEQAIEKLKNNVYDCILMDIQMPVMDGNTATRLIRQNKKYRHLPILALSAKVLDSDRRETIDAGMNCHIAKPINLEQLLDEIAYWVVCSRQKQNEENKALGHNNTMAECIEKVGGDKDLFLKILSVFIEKHRDYDVQIIKMLQEGKNVNAKKLIHSLKGVALVVGATELHGITVKLEKTLLKESDLETAPLLKQFGIDLQNTISCLQRYIASSDSQSHSGKVIPSLK